MATIKAIEAKSVHQIQSGQVIVDLCSVVKELVENSLDSGATNLEVSFKNYGLDAIEVRDNGCGITPDNYASVALKHFTSKLSSYDDLSSLQTFGFRGEALSSLCALSKFSMATAQANEAPKGTRLEFEPSGALKGTATVAAQKGATATVEDLFEKLPVRRKELAKNIKREYGKVLSLLHAYACIGVNVKFTVKSAMPKAKSMVVFSTRGNATTRDNIANVYGAKTLSALVALDLYLDFQPTLTQTSRDDAHITQVAVQGHISRPVFGEGRQTPDRQMFFVNGRPCGLPQIAKAINEVYKSFNVSQSPFIFADLRMDTNAYDVNVSPDKRTILLHNAASLIERLKVCLTEMFDKQEQTMPQSQLHTRKLPAFKQLNVQRQTSVENITDDRQSIGLNSAKRIRLHADDEALDESTPEELSRKKVFHSHFANQTSTREEPNNEKNEKEAEKLQKAREKEAKRIAEAMARHEELGKGVDEYDDVQESREQQPDVADEPESPHAIRVRDFNARMAEQQPRAEPSDHGSPREDTHAVESVVQKNTGVVHDAFDRMRPKRAQAQFATVTIDDESTTHIIGTQFPSFGNDTARKSKQGPVSGNEKASVFSKFSQGLRKFGASETHEAIDQDGPEKEVEQDQEDSNPRRGSIASLEDTSQSEDEAETESPKLDADLVSGDSQSQKEISDDEYVDEAEKKAEEEARVAELIRAAEESASMPSKKNLRRANKALKGDLTKDSTTSLLTTLDTSIDQLRTQMETLRKAIKSHPQDPTPPEEETPSANDEETRLSLTVSKHDFSTMEICGQFNLGFILAVRRSCSAKSPLACQKDELFIVDQHASDEKYNFERLQASTVVETQRMVQPVTLSLTAVEEEIILENTRALAVNGFIVSIDLSGDAPVGRRVTLTSLPLSKEVTFDTRDLEELIHLLSENPLVNADSPVPRPGRVRKMFAMRACRSSIMIGRTLTRKKMERVVRNMGSLEKPWNCPHGRPTMRHLAALGEVEGRDERGDEDGGGRGRLWRDYLGG